MQRLFRQPDGLLAAGNLVMPPEHGATREGLAAASYLKDRRPATVVVDLHTLLVTRRAARFGLDAPLAAPGAWDRPQCLQSLAVMLVEFVDRLHASRGAEHIVFAGESPAHQHPLKVAHAAARDARSGALRAAYSRSDETTGFLPLVPAMLEPGALPGALLQSALGASLTRGGLLLTEMLSDRRIGPALFSLLFQTVFAEIRARADRGEAALASLRVTYAGPIYDFSVLCDSSEHPFLPNSLVMQADGTTYAAEERAFLYSLPDVAACLTLMLEHTVDSGGSGPVQFEVISDADSVALAAILHHYKRADTPHPILVRTCDDCAFDAGAVATRHMPRVLEGLGLEPDAMILIVFYLAYFGGDLCAAPVGFDATEPAFRKTLAMAAALIKAKGLAYSTLLTVERRSRGPWFQFLQEHMAQYVALCLTGHMAIRGYDMKDNLKTYLNANRTYPEWHPIHALANENHGFAQYPVSIDISHLTPDRFRALSIGLLQRVHPPPTPARGPSEQYSPTETHFPRVFSDASTDIGYRYHGRKGVWERSVRAEDSLALTDPAKAYIDYARDDIEARTTAEIRGGLPTTMPCPLEVTTDAVIMRAAAISASVLLLMAGHLPQTRRTGANAVALDHLGYAFYAVRNQWLVETSNPSLERSAADPDKPMKFVDILVSNASPFNTNAYADLNESGLPLFVRHPGAPVTDAALMRRAQALVSDAPARLLALMDEALPQWRAVRAAAEHMSPPPDALPALLRCLVADEHARAPAGRRVVEPPLGLYHGVARRAHTIYPTTRAPELPALCNPGMSSADMGNLFLPFTYHEPAPWTSLLAENSAAPQRAVPCPVALFTEDGAASAVVYADNETDFADTADLAVTGLYLESLHERCAVAGAGRIPERLVHSLLARSANPTDLRLATEAGAAHRLPVDAAWSQRLVSMSADVTAYAVPMLARGLPEAVWHDTLRPMAALFRRPMEAAYRALCLWKASEAVAAAHMAAGGALVPHSYHGLEPLFGEDARQIADAILLTRSAPVPDDAHGAWATAALAFARVDLRGSAAQVQEGLQRVAAGAAALADAVPVPVNASVRLVRAPGMAMAEVALHNWPAWAAAHFALHVAQRMAGSPEALREMAAAPQLGMALGDDSAIDTVASIAIVIANYVQ